MNLNIWVFCPVNALMLLLNTSVVAIALLNFKVIRATSVIHTNLKFVLLVQSGMIACWSLSETVLAVFRFVVGNCSMPQPPWWICINIFFDEYVILIGNVLLLERVLATAYSSRYENYKNHHFNVVWSIALTIVCFLNSVSVYLDTMNNGGTGLRQIRETIITNFVLLSINFLEIFAVIKLGMYNIGKYSMNRFYSGTKHSLSERYQLSENVRAIRQLGVVFVAHFAQALGSFLGFCFEGFISRDLFESTMEGLMFCLFFTVTNLVIVTSVMRFHPVLRNKAFRLIFSRPLFASLFCCCCKSNRVLDSNTDQNPFEQPPIGVVNGKELVVPLDQERDIYFQLLGEQWA